MTHPFKVDTGEAKKIVHQILLNEITVKTEALKFDRAKPFLSSMRIILNFNLIINFPYTHTCDLCNWNQYLFYCSSCY